MKKKILTTRKLKEKNPKSQLMIVLPYLLSLHSKNEAKIDIPAYDGEVNAKKLDDGFDS